MDQLISFANKTEGRDKFCKAVQYFSRFLKHKTANSKETQARWNGMMVGMRDARKLFRLFKTLNEIQTILKLKNTNMVDKIEQVLQIVTRIGFGLYWIFDNIVVLCTIKFLKRDAKTFSIHGMRFWFLALVTSLISAVRLFIISMQKEARILQKIANGDK